jgi:hypothetical protein
MMIPRGFDYASACAQTVAAIDPRHHTPNPEIKHF